MNKKQITLTITDNKIINEVFGQRGILYVEASVEKVDKDNRTYGIDYNFEWASSFTEEKGMVNEEVEKDLIVALAQLGLSGEKLYALEEGIEHHMPVEKDEVSQKQKEVFLVFSTDQWQNNDSYELEGVSSSLEEAQKVVIKIFEENPIDTKAVIKATRLDSNDFNNIEVYDCFYGLEWRTEDSLTELGYLAKEEEEGEDD